MRGKIDQWKDEKGFGVVAGVKPRLFAATCFQL